MKMFFTNMRFVFSRPRVFYPMLDALIDVLSLTACHRFWGNFIDRLLGDHVHCTSYLDFGVTVL